MDYTYLYFSYLFKYAIFYLFWDTNNDCSNRLCTISCNNLIANLYLIGIRICKQIYTRVVVVKSTHKRAYHIFFIFWLVLSLLFGFLVLVQVLFKLAFYRFFVQSEVSLYWVFIHSYKKKGKCVPMLIKKIQTINLKHSFLNCKELSYK